MNPRQRRRWRRYLLRMLSHPSPLSFAAASATGRRQQQLITQALAARTFGGWTAALQLGYRQNMADQVDARCVPCTSGHGRMPVCYGCGHKHWPGTRCPTHTWTDTCPYEGTGCTTVRTKGTS